MLRKHKTTEHLPIYNLKYLMDQNKLNFSPSYQRDYVWKNSQKELFIDSLLLGYDIPKIYFHRNPKGSYEYDVVDGQQRLKTIRAFLQNEIKCHSEAENIGKESIRNKQFNELSTDLQMIFNTITLDVVILDSEYTSDDIEDMFLRYQNGEPLNAAEKRKAIAGNFKDVVEELAGHKIFSKCNFPNHRDAYQDTIAKILHIRIFGNFTSISADSIRRTYKNNADITLDNKNVREVEKILNFLNDSFEKSSNKTPKLKKYAILTLAEIAHHFIENYNINSFKKEFADAYLDFEKDRLINNELEEQQNIVLNDFTDAARGDSAGQQRDRYETLMEYILIKIPNLSLKDSHRLFSTEQKIAMYRRDSGKCQNKDCGKEISFDESEADHIIPHSKGGETKLSNGQLLCSTCNNKKRAK